MLIEVICRASHKRIARDIAAFLGQIGVDSASLKFSIVPEVATSSQPPVLVSLIRDDLGARQQVLPNDFRSSDRRHVIVFQSQDAIALSGDPCADSIDYSDAEWQATFAMKITCWATRSGEALSPELVVAAASAPSTDKTRRQISEGPRESSLSADWFIYNFCGDYWTYINGLIQTQALGGLYRARRQISEWIEPEGSYVNINVSEFYRKDCLVSLMITSDNYFIGSAHPNRSVWTLNVLGEQVGLVETRDLFDDPEEGLMFLTGRLSLYLKEKHPSLADAVDLTDSIESCGWDYYREFSFGQHGIQLNIAPNSGLPHALGFRAVHVPWALLRPLLSPLALSVGIAD